MDRNGKRERDYLGSLNKQRYRIEICTGDMLIEK